MTAIFWITSFLVLLYLIYPLYLLLFSESIPEKEKETCETDGVSLILLSYNGRQYLKDKIDFCLRELFCFKYHELIIVDDNSTDGSKEELENFCHTDHVKIICKNERKGIPDSMNTGINEAKYEFVIFCDQRQRLSDNIMKRIVEPLKYESIGAVSACISNFDRNKNYSFIRQHENSLKAKESKTGCLIGVYGPLYSIKKSCYIPIPDYIILDDLYLSLKILKTKQIKLLKDCYIVDDDFSKLYDYKRSKRYLKGLLQLINEKKMIGDLGYKQRTMLIWHKYLRLLIPFFIILSYLFTGVMMVYDIRYIILFSLLTLLGLISIMPVFFKMQFRLNNLIRIIVFYFIACFDIFITGIFHKINPGIIK
jgi:glycosyltransferase involved in cell wall biosynthesis